MSKINNTKRHEEKTLQRKKISQPNATKQIAGILSATEGCPDSTW